jgi:type IV pilus assembly protein PilM
MQLTSKSKPSTLVGLEIEAGSIAATEVKANGSIEVMRTAIAPLNPGIVSEGEVHDAAALSSELKSFFAKNKLGKTVTLGVANQRVVVRTLRMPLIEDEKELDTAVRFQAQDHIPMPLDQAVLDHQVVAKESAEGGDRHMDVVAVAARRDMVNGLISALRKAGLKPAAIDLSAFGMIRALTAGEPEPVDGAVVPTILYCHLGDVTNLAVARGSTCLFTRIAPYGMENMATRVAESEQMASDEAREWLLEVGLEDPIEDFGPDREEAENARNALSEGASRLADELRVSMEFYGAQEGAPPIDEIVLCGPASMIPGLPEKLSEALGRPVELESPAALSQMDEEDAARLTVSYGLALGG